MRTVAQEVAELIHAEAQSGSASWDEMGGPSAVLTQVSPTKYTVALPARYTDDDNDEPTGPTCLITVESTEAGKPATCLSEIRHGPGHQSSTRCEVTGVHEVHRAIYGSQRQEATWRGTVAYTGVFDEPPAEES